MKLFLLSLLLLRSTESFRPFGAIRRRVQPKEANAPPLYYQDEGALASSSAEGLLVGVPGGLQTTDQGKKRQWIVEDLERDTEPRQEREPSSILLRQMVAELCGTFLIVHLSMAAALSVPSAADALLQGAAVTAAAISVAVNCLSSISGAHFNPAITLALAVYRNFSWSKVLPYTVAQLLGTAAAAAMNMLLYGGRKAAAASVLSFNVPFGTAITAEAFGTGILLAVVFALTHADNDSVSPGWVAPLIGMTVGSLICTLAPVTGCCLNPARDLGPRLLSLLAGSSGLRLGQALVYALAPVLGGLLGATVVDKFLFHKKKVRVTPTAIPQGVFE